MEVARGESREGILNPNRAYGRSNMSSHGEENIGLVVVVGDACRIHLPLFRLKRPVSKEDSQPNYRPSKGRFPRLIEDAWGSTGTLTWVTTVPSQMYVLKNQ